VAHLRSEEIEDLDISFATAGKQHGKSESKLRFASEKIDQLSLDPISIVLADCTKINTSY